MTASKSLRLSSRVFVAADDLGYLEKRPVAFRRVLQDLLQRKARLHHVFAKDVMQRQGMSHRLDAGGIDLAQLGDIAENRFELAGEAL